MNKKRIWKIGWLLSLLLLLFFVCFPLVQMFSVAFKDTTEQFALPVTFLPRHWTLENFRQAIAYEAFRTYFKNSLIVAVVTTSLTIVISLLGAYGFTRTHFPGRKVFLMMVLFSQMICLAAISVPVYRIISKLNLTDTYTGLIISYLAYTVPVGIWLLRGFIQGIPVELEESARVDGASKFQAFYKVVLPLLRPGIGAAGAYVFFLSWQEFLFSLIIMTDKSKRTLPTGIMDYVGQYETSWGSMMASSILLALPVFVIFAAVQKQLVAGLTDGAVKG